MFRKAFAATALFAALVAPLAASAGEVQNRVNHEQQRINQGAESGTLSYREYQGLDNRLDHIQAQRNRDLRRNDGHLTRGEYRQLNREENQLSDHIWYDKHDGPGR